jgi:FkbM family methyltransferase
VQGIKKSLLKIVNFILAPLAIEVRSVYSGGRLFPKSFECLKKVLPSISQKASIIDVGVANETRELWTAFPPSEYKYLLVEANPIYTKELTRAAKNMGAILEMVFCGDHDGTETFITDDAYDSGKASKYSRKTGGSEKRSNVPSLKLDTIIKKHFLQGPYILKIDVEGAELDVLRGSLETLTNTEAVIIEAPVIVRKEGGSSFGEIVAYLHNQGFVVFDIAEMSYHQKNGFLNLTNIIFIRK